MTADVRFTENITSILISHFQAWFVPFGAIGSNVRVQCTCFCQKKIKIHLNISLHRRGIDVKQETEEQKLVSYTENTIPNCAVNLTLLDRMCFLHPIRIP